MYFINLNVLLLSRVIQDTFMTCTSRGIKSVEFAVIFQHILNCTGKTIDTSCSNWRANATADWGMIQKSHIKEVLDYRLFSRENLELQTLRHWRQSDTSIQVMYDSHRLIRNATCGVMFSRIPWFNSRISCNYSAWCCHKFGSNGDTLVYIYRMRLWY